MNYRTLRSLLYHRQKALEISSSISHHNSIVDIRIISLDLNVLCASDEGEDVTSGQAGSFDDDEKVSKPKELERVCSMHLENIRLKLSLHRGEAYKVYLRAPTLEVFDTRSPSKDYEYRQIVRKAGSFATKIDKSAFDASTSSSSASLSLTNPAGRGPSHYQSTEPDPILDFTMTVNDKDKFPVTFDPSLPNAAQVLDIFVSNLMATVYIDVLADIGNVANGIAFSILHIVAPPKGSEESQRGKNNPASTYEGENSTKSAHVPTSDKLKPTVDDDDDDDDFGKSPRDYHGTRSSRGLGTIHEDPSLDNDGAEEDLDSMEIFLETHMKNMVCRVSMSNAHVLMLEDPAIASTRSVLATFEVQVNMNVGIWGGESLKETSEHLKLKVKAVEVFVVPDTSQWLESQGHIQTQQLCYPFEVDCILERRLEREIVIKAKLDLKVSGIDINVCLNNIPLLDNILARRTLTGLVPTKVDEEGSYVLFGKFIGVGGSDVDAYSVTVHIGTIVIIAMPNPSTGNATSDSEALPILRLVVDAVSFHASGALHPRVLMDSTEVHADIEVTRLDGDAKLNIAADFFNPEIAMWEPVRIFVVTFHHL